MDESAMGQTSQEAKKPRCASAREWISQGMKQPEGETTKGRKSHNSCRTYRSRQHECQI